MAKIYQIVVDDEWINDVYYYECDALDNAMEIADRTDLIVEIWEAEEIEDVPYDALEWSTIWRA